MSISYENICAFLYREARYLDDRDWDSWLALYDENATFWMPAWDDDGELTDDPQSQISLIYYARRAGLEDRVFRIRTGSGQRMPLREAHRARSGARAHAGAQQFRQLHGLGYSGRCAQLPDFYARIVR